MTKKAFLFITVILSSVMLAGCSQKTPETTTIQEDQMVRTEDLPEIQLSPTSESSDQTLSNSTETEDLQQELEGTIINQEDFSDL